MGLFKAAAIEAEEQEREQDRDLFGECARCGEPLTNETAGDLYCAPCDTYVEQQ